MILGDPHLGRKFIKGVPLERRGEREQLVREDFVARLAAAEGNSHHICMGDLFDAPQVDYDTLLFAIQSYRTAARLMPGTTFYILQGNHDDSRDLDEVTAWDLFCDAMETVSNVVPVTKPTAVPGLGWLLPWHPTRTAVEQLGDGAEAILYGLTTAYGHWDVDPRSSHHNLIPTVALARAGITRAFTGHVHKPDQFIRDGVDVTVVGSMQPYAQGEDGEQSSSVKYVTLTLDDLDGIRDLTDCCVRLQLQPGEQFTGEIPVCRSWNVERVRAPEEMVLPADASMKGFDIRKAFDEAFEGRKIIPEVRTKIEHRWGEVFNGGGEG